VSARGAQYDRVSALVILRLSEADQFEEALPPEGRELIRLIKRVLKSRK
jgi:hypothetical protein